MDVSSLHLLRDCGGWKFWEAAETTNYIKTPYCSLRMEAHRDLFSAYLFKDSCAAAFSPLCSILQTSPLAACERTAVLSTQETSSYSVSLKKSPPEGNFCFVQKLSRIKAMHGKTRKDLEIKSLSFLCFFSALGRKSWCLMQQRRANDHRRRWRPSHHCNTWQPSLLPRLFAPPPTTTLSPSLLPPLSSLSPSLVFLLE